LRKRGRVVSKNEKKREAAGRASERGTWPIPGKGERLWARAAEKVTGRGKSSGGKGEVLN